MIRFEKQARLTYAECDFRGELRLSAVMRHIQETAGEHLDALELPRSLLWSEGYVFLLTRVRLDIRRLPAAGETITIATQPYEPKGAQYFRDIFFSEEQGKALLTARTAWVLADPETHRIRRPSELPHKLAYAQEEYDYSWARERMVRPDTAQDMGTRTVRLSDIDVNMHLNNAVYSDIVCDLLPLDFYRTHRPREYTVSFIAEAQLGAELKLCAAQTEPGIWYVGAEKENGHCFEAQGKWVKRDD